VLTALRLTELAVVLLALFAQMEGTYMLERAAHARAVATAKGRRVTRRFAVGRTPRLSNSTKLARAGMCTDPMPG